MIIFALLLLIPGAASAAELERVQVWQTLGCALGACFGVQLVEVEKAPTGSLVRLVSAIDGGCHGTIIQAWEKRLDHVTPSQMLRRARLCETTQEQVNRRAERHRSVAVPEESDASWVKFQCDGEMRMLSIPYGLENVKDHSSDERFFSRYWNIEGDIMQAGFGKSRPNMSLNVEDPVADELGQKIVETAKRSGELYRPLAHDSKYKGPQGSLAADWRLELPEGVKALRFEPSGADLYQTRQAFMVKTVLTVNRATGRVVRQESQGTRDGWSGEVAGAANQAQFDPATIPTDGKVPVTVVFKPTCLAK